MNTRSGSEQPFASGGYLPDATTLITLDPAECIFPVRSTAAGRPVCGRRDKAHADAAHDGEVPPLFIPDPELVARVVDASGPVGS